MNISNVLESQSFKNLVYNEVNFRILAEVVARRSLEISKADNVQLISGHNIKGKDVPIYVMTAGEEAISLISSDFALDFNLNENLYYWAKVHKRIIHWAGKSLPATAIVFYNKEKGDTFIHEVQVASSSTNDSSKNRLDVVAVNVANWERGYTKEQRQIISLLSLGPCNGRNANKFKNINTDSDYFKDFSTAVENSLRGRPLEEIRSENSTVGNVKQKGEEDSMNRGVWEVAVKMKKSGVDLNIISEATGIELQYLRAIKC